MKSTKSENLKVYVIWTPVLPADTREAAEKALREMPDKRAVHFWDKDRSLGLAFGKVVALPRGRKLAWDVYFAYSAKSTWEKEPPKPADWMHQLGRDQRSFDARKLRTVVEKLLEAIKGADPEAKAGIR